MGEILRERLRQSRFESPTHEAILNLLVASAHVRALLDRAFEGHEITLGQFNVLRILRGAHPEGYPRYEIVARLVERAPDLTRMIDRLEARGLVERARSDRDRRHSVTRITRRGLELLEELQPAIDRIYRDLAGRLPRRDAQELSRICERLYGR